MVKPVTRLEIIYKVVMTNHSTECVVWPFAARYKGALTGNRNRHIAKIICEMRTGVKQGARQLCEKYCHTDNCIRHVRWTTRE